MGFCLYRHERGREAGVKPEVADVRTTTEYNLPPKANINSIYICTQACAHHNAFVEVRVDSLLTHYMCLGN